jgi:hypothetical protein
VREVERKKNKCELYWNLLKKIKKLARLSAVKFTEKLTYASGPAYFFFFSLSATLEKKNKIVVAAAYYLQSML